jgi:hypothetical protein
LMRPSWSRTAGSNAQTGYRGSWCREGLVLPDAASPSHMSSVIFSWRGETTGVVARRALPVTDQVERFCNNFAAALLLPRGWIRERYSRRRKNLSTISTSDQPDTDLYGGRRGADERDPWLAGLLAPVEEGGGEVEVPRWGRGGFATPTDTSVAPSGRQRCWIRSGRGLRVTFAERSPFGYLTATSSWKRRQVPLRWSSP